MQISSFICTEIGKKKHSRQFTNGIEALHSRFRQAWWSCLQFTLVSECKSETEDMDMELDISCAEGVWMCTNPHHGDFTIAFTQGRRSRLWITSFLETWRIVGGLSEPILLGSWLPAPSPARATSLPRLTTYMRTAKAAAAKGAFNFSLGSWF